MATKLELDLDPERERALVGLMLLEAVDDTEAWAMFWRAVTHAHTRFVSNAGSGEGDAPSG